MIEGPKNCESRRNKSIAMEMEIMNSI